MNDTENTNRQSLPNDSGTKGLQAAKEQLNRLTVIYELTKAIISAHDFSELLEKVSEETAKLFNAKGCMIRLIEDGMLKVKAHYGFPPSIVEALTVNLGESFVGKVAVEGRTMFAQSPEDFGRLSQHVNMQTALCTPLKIGDQIIGTFGLYDKKNIDKDGNESIVPFTTDDQTTLEGFASIAAIVIDKSILYDNTLKKEKEALNAKQKFEDLWDHLQGFIENSADAIVTTDMEGIVTSWNLGAEKIYGYTRPEALGNYMPFVPDFLRETENVYTRRVKRGETVKDIETVRKTKEGRLLEVNLTLSPIKDTSGEVIGISGIARDITEKRRIEKDLVGKNTVLSKLMMISSAMRGTLELNKLLRMVLTAVTMGDGLGFNRAMLFLPDEEKNILRGAVGVGPSSHEEAWEIWSLLSTEQKSLASIMEEIEKGPLREDSFMDRLCRGVEVSMDSETILTKAMKEKQAFNVTDVHSEPLSDPILIQQLGTLAYAVLPLISRGKVIGVLWVDNIYTGRSITDLDMEFLKGFSDQMASAIENARLFEHVAQAEHELENIFESISDLVYFSSRDYVVRKANKAVMVKIGKPLEAIIGKKCYEVFHGTGQPWEKCPHHKTMLTKKPFIEELEDPQLGGTFLVSTSPIFDKTGELIGTVHIVRDISELKKLREKVAAAERMAALGEMAAKVAHEIRNPLLSIGGFARRLEKRLEGDLKEFSKIIVDEVSRLEGILNDALSFVKSAPLKKTVFDLGEIIDSVITLLEPAILTRGNSMTRELARPVKMRADHDRIKEVLLNLATNANEATDHGNITIRSYQQVTLADADLLGHRVASGNIIVEIEDSGCGIKEDAVSRVFDPFFTTRPNGTGLGLSISKRIVEEHGGRIEVESNWGLGTKFKIYIPLQEG
ncbi:MAG TPA: PAS domain S-box protein [Dissulfurispiraceae bacterium]|nr:PAS domain S-box protein [Dissulfurispiraceae bacterium]